jgi:hypothetical protein
MTPRLMSYLRKYVGHTPELCTYFILNRRANRVKIGKSKFVYERFRTLQTACPDTLEILGILPLEGIGDGMRTLTPEVPLSEYLEENLHSRFKKYRKKGEWFEYSPEIKEFLKHLYEEGL